MLAKILIKGGTMKILGLVVGFMLLASLAFGEVTAKILATDLDDNGNIIVKTSYAIDGKNVESRYPPITIKDKDGKDIQVYYWQTRYTVQNFAGMNETQTITRIKQDLSQFAQSLIAKKYITEENAKLNLTNVIGQTVTEMKATIGISPTLEWEVDTNGTKTDKIIVPKEITP